MAKRLPSSEKSKRIAADTLTHIFLAIMCFVWLIPFVWLVMQSFRDGKGQFISTFFPTERVEGFSSVAAARMAMVG